MMRKLVALVGVTLLCAYLAPREAGAADDEILREAGGGEAGPVSAGGRLVEQAKEDSIDAQRRSARSRYYSEMGRKLYGDLKYEEAIKQLERALEIDPSNAEAARYLRLARNVTGVRLAKVRSTFEILQTSRKVKIQELLLQLRNLYGRGLELYKSAERPEAAEGGKEALLAASIRDLGDAIEVLDRAGEIIRWMPYDVNLDTQRGQVRDLSAKAKQLRRIRIAALEAVKKAKAIDEAQARKAVERDFEGKKVRKLLDQAEMLYDHQQYEQCEKLAREILRMDPMNGEAIRLHVSSRANKHLKKSANISERRREERITLNERLEEATVPWSHYLVYPPDWEIIKERQTVSEVERDEPSWKKEIRKQMDRRVTFEFVDTPLEEAINFLQTLTKVNMILDPNAFTGGGGADVPITLKVSDMELSLALKWILRLAELDYTLKNEAVFISTPQNLAGEVELKIYDVRDLTEQITQFPGPEIVIGTGGGGAASGFGPVLTGGGGGSVAFGADSLAEMIQTRIRPDSWAAELGTSIEDREGRLVVMQRPEVHRLIEQLLRSLRESQTLQVIVQARFLEVRDEFIEEIGVQFADETTTPLIDDAHPMAPSESSGFSHTDTRRPTQRQFGGDYIYTGRTEFIHRRNPAFGSRLNVSTPIASGQGAVFQFRYINGIQANAILTALTKEENGEELMAPKLTMYNNQRAHLIAASQHAYISDYNTSGGIYEPVVDALLEGTVLDVRPTVSHDRRYVTLELRPGNARLTNLRPVTISGLSLNLIVELPVVEFRSVRTTVTLPDGGTILMSGLMLDNKFDAHDGVPFLSDLPIIGRIFGSDLKQRFKRNLLIVVSAQLILFDEEEAKL